ncbi:MAG TPA: hypothetical protein VGW09_00135 [Nitrososphaeraceae archaeon]|nr:hypothetical protein [Nitrososphaeraceae archaeon]
MVKTIIAISLLSMMTATMALQIQSGDASTGNATQAANQTGEQMQSGMENVTQESKSAGNQTGEQMQSGMENVTQESKSAGNKTGEEGQSMLNEAGEALQQINPFK